VNENFVREVVERFPGGIREALVERGQLLAHAAEEVRKFGEKIKLSLKEEQAQKGFRLLAVRLREATESGVRPGQAGGRCSGRR